MRLLRADVIRSPPLVPLPGKQILFRLVDVPERGEFTPLPATETRREWLLASWEGMGVGGSRLHAVKNITPPGKIKSGRCYVCTFRSSCPYPPADHIYPFDSSSS